MRTLNLIGYETKKALDELKKSKEEDELEIISDRPTDASEMKRTLETLGFEVGITDDDGSILLSAEKIKNDTSEHEDSNNYVDIYKENDNKENIIQENINQENVEKVFNGNTVYVFSSYRGISKSRNYIKKYFSSIFEGILRSERVPEIIVLLNDSVKLALYNSKTCDYLKMMEGRGVRILVSGMSSDNFGITESIGAGIIAEIDEILEVISECEKVVNF